MCHQDNVRCPSIGEGDMERSESTWDDAERPLVFAPYWMEGNQILCCEITEVHISTDSEVSSFNPKEKDLSWLSLVSPLQER